MALARRRRGEDSFNMVAATRSVNGKVYTTRAKPAPANPLTPT